MKLNNPFVKGTLRLMMQKSNIGLWFSTCLIWFVTLLIGWHIDTLKIKVKDIDSKAKHAIKDLKAANDVLISHIHKMDIECKRMHERIRTLENERQFNEQR